MAAAAVAPIEMPADGGRLVRAPAEARAGEAAVAARVAEAPAAGAPLVGVPLVGAARPAAGAPGRPRRAEAAPAARSALVLARPVTSEAAGARAGERRYPVFAEYVPVSGAQAFFGAILADNTSGARELFAEELAPVLAVPAVGARDRGNAIPFWRGVADAAWAGMPADSRRRIQEAHAHWV